MDDDGLAGPTPTGALLTDLYQLTMGYGYWKSARHNRRSVFHLFFRKTPFGGGFAVAAGIGPALDWLANFQVTSSDIAYLATLSGNDGKPLFDQPFLNAIGYMRLEVDVDAVDEGSVVFAHEPLMRISGPLWQCQWIETALLAIVNFQTLIATKAARICHAAGGEDVLEFGLRRAQGVDGGLSASRAAYIGGCAATSNVLAGKLYGIPVRGTHAHSWVMSFDTELEAFEHYAAAMPNNCVFLVDTYNTIDGVHNAIKIGRKLEKLGRRMVGVRLDSGDLAALSIQARQLLDAGGFQDAKIVASNDLDEYRIQTLKHEGAKISLWGVGTRLVTGGDQGALGGVYKLASIEDGQGKMQPCIKLSQDAVKTSTPGVQQVRRYFHGDQISHDVIYDPSLAIPFVNDACCVTLTGSSSDKSPTDHHVELLSPVMRNGTRLGNPPSLIQVRQAAIDQVGKLPDTFRQLSCDRAFDVLLEPQLWQLKQSLIEETMADSTSVIHGPTTR
ncbi:nicotinate phosphoribosyltransferase [Rubripirellula amarantea]|nr:nicotinate phosphoribosyltransferase [Rubripirellula amarantea]